MLRFRLNSELTWGRRIEFRSIPNFLFNFKIVPGIFSLSVYERSDKAWRNFFVPSVSFPSLKREIELKIKKSEKCAIEPVFLHSLEPSSDNSRSSQKFPSSDSNVERFIMQDAKHFSLKKPL